MVIKDRAALPDQLASTGLMAIVRASSSDAAERMSLRLAESGVRMLEISFTTPGAAEAITRVRAALPAEVLVGAGTVVDRADAVAAVSHGADFLVAPGFDPEVATYALEFGLGYYPGAATATEIVAAWRAGATAVKVFPVGALGLPFFRAIREPLPDIRLLAVGGIGVGDAPSFIEAGAVAVGLGGALVAAETDLRSLIAALAHAVKR